MPAAALLEALGLTPGEPAQGDGHIAAEIRDELAALRAQFEAVDTPEPRSAQPRGDGAP